MKDLSNKSDCIIQGYNNRVLPIAVASDQKSRYTYRFVNRSQFSITQYKGECLSEERSKSCDSVFVLRKKGKQAVCLVELKGGAIGDAVKQIQNTLDTLQIRKESSLDWVNGRIITSKTYGPKMQSSEYKRLMKRIISLGGTLKPKTGDFEETL